MKTLGPIAAITGSDPDAPPERLRLGKAGTLARLALIGVVLAARIRVR